MNREPLPNRRACETFNFSCTNGQRYTATAARFADGRIGEIFLGSPKAGSEADTNARDAAVVCSIALQHGVPVEIIRLALMRDATGRAGGPLGSALDILTGALPLPTKPVNLVSALPGADGGLSA